MSNVIQLHSRKSRCTFLELLKRDLQVTKQDLRHLRNKIICIGHVISDYRHFRAQGMTRKAARFNALNTPTLRKSAR